MRSRSASRGAAHANFGISYADTNVGHPLVHLLVMATSAFAVLTESILDHSFTVELSILAGSYGVLVFLVHAGRRISTLGLFNLASALFIGYAGFDQASAMHRLPGGDFLSEAIAGALIAQALVTMLSWNGARGTTVSSSAIIDKHSAHSSIVAGTAIVAVSALAQAVDAPFAESYLGEGLAFSGILLAAAGLILRRGVHLISFSSFAVVVLFILYAEVFHAGTGRLRIVALACSLAILVSIRFPRHHLKPLVVTAIPAALWWLARDRLALQESISRGASEGRTGLESMMSPLTTFAHMLAAQAEGWDLRLGSSFFSLPFALLPDEAVPEWAPRALGYDLVTLTAPHRVGTGFSEASTVYGEWVWNFGVAGLLLMCPFLALAITLLDKGIFRAPFIDTTASPLLPLLRLLIVIMLSGTIADLAWSGLHTFGTRVLTRLPILLLLYAVWWIFADIASVPRETGSSGSRV